MAELKAITEDNFLDAFNLKLAPGQEAFVSSDTQSRAGLRLQRSVSAVRHLCRREIGRVCYGDLRLRRSRVRHLAYDDRRIRAGTRLRWLSARSGHRLHPDEAVRRFGQDRPDLQQAKSRCTEAVRKQGLCGDRERG